MYRWDQQLCSQAGRQKKKTLKVKQIRFRCLSLSQGYKSSQRQIERDGQLDRERQLKLLIFVSHFIR